MNCRLYEAKTVKFTFEQRNNPYFLRKHYKEPQKQMSPKEGNAKNNPKHGKHR